MLVQTNHYGSLHDGKLKNGLWLDKPEKEEFLKVEPKLWLGYIGKEWGSDVSSGFFGGNVV